MRSAHTFQYRDLPTLASDSEVNSYKRLNHEVGDKATLWRAAFADQAEPAVLAGVFSLDNLEATQRVLIAIFWRHNLEALVEFAAEAMSYNAGYSLQSQRESYGHRPAAPS